MSKLNPTQRRAHAMRAARALRRNDNIRAKGIGLQCDAFAAYKELQDKADAALAKAKEIQQSNLAAIRMEDLFWAELSMYCLDVDAFMSEFYDMEDDDE